MDVIDNGVKTATADMCGVGNRIVAIDISCIFYYYIQDF